MRGDVAANAATAAELIREAGARVVVLPEKFLSGYEPDLIGSDPTRYAVAAGDARLDPIAEACRESGSVAVVGAATHEDGALFISSLVFGASGDLVARYDKQFLFRSERELFQPGRAGCTIEVDGWRLGLGICYDCGFPEHARAAARAGADAYLVSALFSVGNGFHESRTWLPARALDNTVYVVLSNHVGTTGGWNACGGSAIWGPDGRVVAQAGPDETTIVGAVLDPARLARVRAAEPLLEDFSRPEPSALRDRVIVKA
ncbi:putative amidohydrolase [Streptoalloteichus tenebrarius]|uniref:Amidohydrolase n=1 Tax=Streptoalloteichus tenebrarius (strain ATCC 17920 / DSM 40477 / JCM 4838 / CBS 697.72 / NBRC 16177 / NCIMB 11028 / NRRL B-12390 / A12253. 1 / ISP 5477) TaxID=1933 RepID=A0ABT1HNQ0_STRSD|nr:putative amidohydrolase [Streptoalloteichus tenebrarius]